MRYFYLDESTFGTPNKYVAYGALVTDTQVPMSLVTTALANLRSDPDIVDPTTKKWDDDTLARGYFHACEDSKNGHSHLCTQISKDVLGVFNAHYFDPDNLDPQITPGGKTSDLLSQLTALEAFGTDQQVEFRFERRSGLSVPDLQKWHATFEENVLATIYDHPGIPTYFPLVSFQIAHKTDPGIQCTDFVLWSLNRLINGDSKWYDRLKVTFRMTTGPRSDNSGSVDLEFQKQLVDPPCYYTFVDAPNSKTPPVSDQDLSTIYIEAERVIHYYANNSVPSTMQHLVPELKRVASNCLVDGHNDQVTDVANCYLRLFDMVPLISGTTSDADKKKLLVSRQQMALCLRKDLADGVRCHDSLSKARRLIIQQDPTDLTF